MVAQVVQFLVQRVGEQCNLSRLAARTLQLQLDLRDVVRSGGLLAQPRQQPPGLGQFRRPLQAAKHVDFGFVKTAEIHQYLPARHQCRRIVRIPAVRFVEQGQCPFLFVEIAVLRGAREQQRNRHPVERLQAVDAVMQCVGCIERPQSRDQFPDHRRVAWSCLLRTQRIATRRAVMAGERFDIRQLHENAGITGLLIQHQLETCRCLLPFLPAGVQFCLLVQFVELVGWIWQALALCGLGIDCADARDQF